MSAPDETGIRYLPAPLDLPTIADEPSIVTPAPAPVVVVEPITEKPAPAPPDRVIRENALYTLLAWVARFVVGVVMICNVFPLSFITAIAAFGWLQRRMQAIALRG